MIEITDEFREAIKAHQIDSKMCSSYALADYKFSNIRRRKNPVLYRETHRFIPVGNTLIFVRILQENLAQ